MKNGKSTKMRWSVMGKACHTLHRDTLPNINFGSNENINIKWKHKMLEKFSEWFSKNSTYITWWIIGWMSFAFFESIGRGNYVMALIDAGLIYWNYSMWRDRDV